jgi:hypothetical protein
MFILKCSDWIILEYNNETQKFFDSDTAHLTLHNNQSLYFMHLTIIFVILKVLLVFLTIIFVILKVLLVFLTIIFVILKGHFQQYFSYIVAVSFIGGGNRSTRRNPPTCHKSLTNFIT